jgi:histidinol phosphatase-like PHP family hydrolase
MTNKSARKSNKMQWYRMDLHLHTPASADYQEPSITYLDILRRAEMRGLDIIAFTDHNTVAGYGAMFAEIEELEMLVRRDRALPEEKRRLAEYHRLLDKILVLPGFEFTATFGFHILGIFSPEMRTRQIEHTLLSLHIPPQVLDKGDAGVGASSDVLSAYRAINDAGGIVIAAHANSTHGVAMRGFDFGGQTRIAYTQDPHLHSLEVTDLDRRGRGTTARFFDGTKPEYPRRMRCIQGSDAHRLTKDPRNEKNLGVGERITEVLLPERTFDALREMFRSSDFARSRPYRGATKEVYDYVQIARESGPSIVQSFHDSMARTGGRLYGIIADVCAFANTNGGTIYIGVAADMTVPPVGVSNLGEGIETLKTEITHRINPPIEVEIDALETSSKTVIRIQVPRGDDPPYAIDDNKIYVREEAETSLAVRDEIVRLVRKGLKDIRSVKVATTTAPVVSVAQPPAVVLPPPVVSVSAPAGQSPAEVPSDIAATGTNADAVAIAADLLAEGHQPALPPRNGRGRGRRGGTATGSRSDRDDAALSNAPRTGVEIIGTETRKGEQYHIMRDLRNGSIVKNVTRSSARRLWHYAIMEHETNPVALERVQWSGNVGQWKRYKRGGVVRYDLVSSENGQTRVFYGVTEEGMHGPWQQFISDEAPEIVEEEEPEQN